jgi:Fe-S-cluster containining protein
LNDEIGARAAAIAAGAPPWPCRKGCDLCCRRLAAVPRLTAPEWELLREGIARLAPAARAEVAARIRNLDAAPPVVCPLLDPAAGVCLVYDHRPVACRTYGFYVERDGGLYCRDILARVERGECENVVWGSAAAVERRLDEFGPRYDLRDLAPALSFE